MQPGDEMNTTYNSNWVNQEPDVINTLDENRELSIDLSTRELGVRYLDEDAQVGDKHEPLYLKRQREREEARRKAWRAKMGLKTIKDEERERQNPSDD